jgi:hypothetical protein
VRKDTEGKFSETHTVMSGLHRHETTHMKTFPINYKESLRCMGEVLLVHMMGFALREVNFPTTIRNFSLWSLSRLLPLENF